MLTVVFALWAAVAPPPALTMSDSDISRVEQWIEAIVDHVPGESDAALDTVQSWSNDDLRTLWINATVLLAMMREGKSFSISIGGIAIRGSKSSVFTVQAEGRPEQEIRYTASQSKRMHAFACAATGDSLCAGVTPDPRAVHTQPLRRVTDLVRQSGDDNAVLRRGAMLHVDIATRATFQAGAVVRSRLPAPQQMRLQVSDGQETDRGEVAIHWILGRLLLDAVTPAGSKAPAPSGDAFVRAWYRATAGWMQQHEEFDTVHVGRAVELFPDDPDVLFLAGCEHEAFASPAIGAATAIAVVPAGFGFDIGSPRVELARAEGLFRRALQARPSMSEARLHLGHVLLDQRRFNDAALQLRDAAPDAAELQYYRWLFLGAAEEGIERYDAAAQAYRRAAALQPWAQAPPLALSELGWRRGDIAGASRELQRLADLPQDGSTTRDPWWTYHTTAGRDGDRWLDELRDRLHGAPIDPRR